MDEAFEEKYSSMLLPEFIKGITHQVQLIYFKNIRMKPLYPAPG
jgi:hypothetical protein